jgi:hypothetical protein
VICSYSETLINLIYFILVRHTNSITKDKTTPSSVTVEVVKTSAVTLDGVVLSFVILLV